MIDSEIGYGKPATSGVAAARWAVVLGRRCDAGDRALLDRLEEELALTVRQTARQFGCSERTTRTTLALLTAVDPDAACPRRSSVDTRPGDAGVACQRQAAPTLLSICSPRRRCWPCPPALSA